jgi:hypothetical protein
MPAPDSERVHESNENHYSILGHVMWHFLFQRAGFIVMKMHNVEFDLQFDNGTKAKENYLVAVLQKSI